MHIEQKLRAKLAQREAEGNLRTLPAALPGSVDFCSNDYLGLAREPALHARIQAAYQGRPGVQNGATGSRLISGNSLYYNEVEEMLARHFAAGRVLLFNSGYAANTALLSAVPQRGDTILYDEYSHASLKEGARLSFAHRHAFRHNDLDDLGKKIRHATGSVFVVAEAVYSMDGDFAPLAALLDVCEAHGAHLVWDEAHSTGLWGLRGGGLAVAAAQEGRIFARLHTFGKAMGGHGACVAGSGTLIEYLVNFARPFIYTTALPLHSVVSVAEAAAWVRERPQAAARLHTLIGWFGQEKARHPECRSGFIPSHSPIQAVRIGGNARTRALAAQVQGAGFDVRPILSPTVPPGQERLRICLHTHNTEAEITALLATLATAMQQPFVAESE